MVKWSGISSFLKAKRSLPAVRVPGVNQEASCSLSVFNAPALPYTLLVLRHLAHRPDMLFFPPSLCLI